MNEKGKPDYPCLIKNKQQDINGYGPIGMKRVEVNTASPGIKNGIGN
jgi:hypothetical protein